MVSNKLTLISCISSLPLCFILFYFFEELGKSVDFFVLNSFIRNNIWSVSQWNQRQYFWFSGLKPSAMNKLLKLGVGHSSAKFDCVLC